jgi:hypothetical protein
LTVTLHLRPEIEAGLLAKAQASGMDVERYLQTLVEQEVAKPSRTRAASNGRQEAVRRMFEFGDKYRLHFGEPITRDSLHECHRS